VGKAHPSGVSPTQICGKHLRPSGQDGRPEQQHSALTVEVKLVGARGLRGKGSKGRRLAQKCDTTGTMENIKQCTENTSLIAYVSMAWACVTHQESKPSELWAEILHVVTLASGRHFPKLGCHKCTGCSKHRPSGQGNRRERQVSGDMPWWVITAKC